MAKYGLFGGNLKDPMQTYEGAIMKQVNEYVYIYDHENMKEQVAAIKLADGQSVKRISETNATARGARG
jgi:hypothetical protein